MPGPLRHHLSANVCSLSQITLHTYLNFFLPENCPILPDPENGMVTLTGVSVGDMATYTCNDGFELMGVQKLTCQEDGTWDNPLPLCMSLAGTLSDQ